MGLSSVYYVWRPNNALSVGTEQLMQKSDWYIVASSSYCRAIVILDSTNDWAALRQFRLCRHICLECFSPALFVLASFGIWLTLFPFVDCLHDRSQLLWNHTASSWLILSQAAPTCPSCLRIISTVMSSPVSNDASSSIIIDDSWVLTRGAEKVLISRRNQIHHMINT